MPHLIAIDIDEAGTRSPSPDRARERRIAIADLLEDNSFTLSPPRGAAPPPGPFRLTLAIRDGRLVLAIRSETDEPLAEIHLSLGPFRQVIRDYSRICASYSDAVKRLHPGQIETIDMARRGIHNEGARLVRERLERKVDLDTDTARRLFTLICALESGN